VSIGIATATGAQLQPVLGFVEAADQSLYRAKAAGRNRFFLQGDTPKGEPLAS
jgi:PleD family two-component response regulator